MNLIDQLREKIDAEHKEAMKALERLAAYLPNGSAGASKHGLRTDGTPVSRGQGSQRDLILAVIQSDWATADVISERSGLTKKQVQGVVNAPDLKDRVQRRGGKNGREYRYQEETTEHESKQ
jgi:hypothetical protein